ncbi:MAG: hypothetical protein ACI4XL_05505 [Bacillus sp. (in: firmicutes)]
MKEKFRVFRKKLIFILSPIVLLLLAAITVEVIQASVTVHDFRKVDWNEDAVQVIRAEEELGNGEFKKGDDGEFSTYTFPFIEVDQQEAVVTYRFRKEGGQLVSATYVFPEMEPVLIRVALENKFGEIGEVDGGRAVWHFRNTVIVHDLDENADCVEYYSKDYIKSQKQTQ